MEAPEDVLKLCEMKEKRERIRWFHARRIFFGTMPLALVDGLSLALQCGHEDALFLVSLFPNGAPATRQEARSVFLAQGEQACCLCWAVKCGAEPREELLRRSAEGGYAWGQALFCECRNNNQQELWLERAVAQGESDAISSLAYRLWEGRKCDIDASRAQLLFQEAAELGDDWAQFRLAKYCCPIDSLEQVMWLRRSAMRSHQGALLRLTESVFSHVDLFDSGGSGRRVFEIGAAFANSDSWKRRCRSQQMVAAGEVAIFMYHQWCAEAKSAVLCWIWLARQEKVAKDIRAVIADLIWEERAAWSERSAPKEQISLA